MAGSVASPTRVGVVGINDRARRLLLPGLLGAPRARLAAVCSRDSEKARAVAAELSTVSHTEIRPFSSARELVVSGDIDALYVNTPLATHVDLCREAISAGCAVICEKPLAPTAAEAGALTRQAERADVRTAVNFTYRSVPGFRLAERLLVERQRADSPLGRPLHARFELLQGHNLMPGFAKGSALLDSGCHLFDAMNALLTLAGCGPVTSVFGEPIGPTPTDDDPDYGWSFLARTSGGITATGLFTRSALGWRNGFRWTLSGDAAAIDVELDADRTATRVARWGNAPRQGLWRTVDLPPDVASDDARFPLYHMDRLVGAVRGEEAFPGFAEALFTNRVAEALARSAAERRWIAV